MSTDLQTRIDAATAAVDARMERDADTIRRLVEHLKAEAFIDTCQDCAARVAIQWRAWDSGSYDTGTGPTEAAAILDLLEK